MALLTERYALYRRGMVLVLNLVVAKRGSSGFESDCGTYIHFMIPILAYVSTLYIEE